ncbi:MAG: DEAD/DEAH box helicase [Pseudodesulfovibrio sp.]|uniref:DEAD/DEAH box helicase n=1 Tax=Pseudodesulfovibrio sp. TaxID=2035812 RepID=UPI003D0AB816
MTIPIEQANLLLDSFRSEGIRNLVAQSNAKYVLHEVNEEPENFPQFDPLLDDKVTFVSYSILSAGASLIEQGVHTEGRAALESAASLLNNIHGPQVRVTGDSRFHELVAAMAFYAGGQYSRAFVALRKVETHFILADLVSAYIKKDFRKLIQKVYSVLIAKPKEFEDQAELDDWAMSVATAEALANLLEGVVSGRNDYFEVAHHRLENALAIAEAGMSYAQWWTIRLLKLMIGNYEDSSLWKTLLPFFPQNTWEKLTSYIRTMAFSRSPVIELWTSQRLALPVALDQTNGGAVVNLKTSGGKTRVAELSILQTLCEHENSKVIYLAPFRSLAFEIERTFSSVFNALGYQVSHLYGGARVSSVDSEIISESDIVIATPEKAKALFRAAPDTYEGVKLIVVDEGHLIGPNERYVRNEVFIDHLRMFARTNSARILMLSAVLPNTEELAEWIASDPKAVISSDWKPSAERFGLLRWNGGKVRLEWKGDTECFNPQFVSSKPLGYGRRRLPFPNTKNEAIAATAIRLTSIGPVMIFSARANSVPGLAQATILALGRDPEPHEWPTHEWEVFEAVCAEELEPESIELTAARLGIICHSNKLPQQVRMAMEHLMRSSPPKVIIATTTLGQGVNIGISSVIVSTPYISQQTISKRDFWNICGRAGRAFVDGEGKVLYAIDEDFRSIDAKREDDIHAWRDARSKKQWTVRKDINLANAYFDAATPDRVESGLLYAVNLLRGIALNYGVDFELLLELIANDDFTPMGDKDDFFRRVFDLVDDELLALNEDYSANPREDEDAAWVEDAFRGALAVIQARNDNSSSSPDEVLAVLKARVKSILHKVPDKRTRRAIVSSSLPLAAAMRIHESLDYFRGIADALILEDSVEALDVAVQLIEGWVCDNESLFNEDVPDRVVLDRVRLPWLMGVGFRQIAELEVDASDVTKDFYGYLLPWVIHAISQKLDGEAEEQRVAALCSVALLVEIGVSSDYAAKIYLAGIRSRLAATELAALNIPFGDSIFRIAKHLRNPANCEEIKALVSETSQKWLDLLVAGSLRGFQRCTEFPPFSLRTIHGVERLYPRAYEGGIHLTTLDGKVNVQVASNDDFPFARVVDDLRYVFYNDNEVWRMEVRDPRCIID